MPGGGFFIRVGSELATRLCVGARGSVRGGREERSAAATDNAAALQEY